MTGYTKKGSKCLHWPDDQLIVYTWHPYDIYPSTFGASLLFARQLEVFVAVIIAQYYPPNTGPFCCNTCVNGVKK